MSGNTVTTVWCGTESSSRSIRFATVLAAWLAALALEPTRWPFSWSESPLETIDRPGCQNAPVGMIELLNVPASIAASAVQQEIRIDDGS